MPRRRSTSSKRNKRSANSPNRRVRTTCRPGRNERMKLFFLLVRLLLGGLFFGHGMQKLKGWFDGYGPEGTGGFFESLGLRPGRQHALAAGASEAGGGAALAIGLATPAAAAAITGVMTTAIRTVHQPNGPWVDRGGW